MQRLSTATLVAGAITALAWCSTTHAQCTATESQRFVGSTVSLSDHFGSAVAINGDLAIAGAPDASTGRAYVFRRTNGVWSEEQELLATDLESGNEFGFSVAIDGDYAVVGTPGSSGHRGAVYVFKYDSGDWSMDVKLEADDAATNDNLGYSVDIFDDAIVAGAPTADLPAFLQDKTGAAYVFRLEEGAWSQEDKIIASDHQSFDEFGTSVSIDDDVLVVGTPLEDAGGQDAGAVYVFNHSGGSWSQSQKIMASDAGALDEFGTSVSMTSNTVIIGAPFDDDAASNAGAAYIFNLVSSTWTEDDKLTPSSASANDEFGTTVDISGTNAVVGAWLSDVFATNAGTAYVYFDSGSAWDEVAQLMSNDGGSSLQLGYAVAVSDDAVFVGERNAPSPSDQVGAAYFYNGVADVDCNENETIDFCDIADGESEDCNGNGVPDECDIADETSEDCNDNDIPDECENDCNGNGIDDACDIAAQTSEDCNGNGIPDECEVGATTDIVFLIDGSGSIPSQVFELEEDSIVEAICGANPAIPVNSAFRAALIQYSSTRIVELSLTLIDSASAAQSVCAAIDEPEQEVEATILGAPLLIAKQMLESNPNALGRYVFIMSDAEPQDFGDATWAAEQLRTMEGIPATICTALVDSECPSSSVFLKNLANTSDAPEYDPSQPEGTFICLDEESDFVQQVEDCIDGAEDPDCDDDGILDDCENDCDCDGVPDDCDTEPDNDENGIPDNCDLCSGCAPDLDDDGMIGFSDLLLLLDAWDTSDEDADLDESGTVGFQDLLILLDAWGPCVEVRACPCEPLSLEEALEAVCLDEDDFDDYVDVLDSGTQQDKDRYECWFEAYLNGGGSCDPPNSCPTPDPFAD